MSTGNVFAKLPLSAAADVTNSASLHAPEEKRDLGLIPDSDSEPVANPPSEFELRLEKYKGISMALAYLYLIYQGLLVVCLTVYYYYQLDMYLPLAFVVTVFICYLRSQTAFIALRLAHKNSKTWAVKNWKELRDWFYWSIALMIIGVIILMSIIPLRISQLVNINLQNLLIINGVDFVVFIAMGIMSICFCHNLLKDEDHHADSDPEHNFQQNHENEADEELQNQAQ